LKARQSTLMMMRRDRVTSQDRLLRSVSYENVLSRGFALVRNEEGALIRRARDVKPGAQGSVQFADGLRAVQFDGAASPKAKPGAAKGKARQRGFFD